LSSICATRVRELDQGRLHHFADDMMVSDDKVQNPPAHPGVEACLDFRLPFQLREPILQKAIH
jgi:hypothetical protein